MNANLLHAFIDSIFIPIREFLQAGVDRLDAVSLTASRGLYLGDFLGPLAAMGPMWVQVVTNLVTAIILLATVMAVVGIWRGYLQAKAGIKWW